MHRSDPRTPTRVYTRKLDRSVAKHNMKVANVPNPNKQMSKESKEDGGKIWREWACVEPKRRRRRA